MKRTPIGDFMNMFYSKDIPGMNTTEKPTSDMDNLSSETDDYMYDTDFEEKGVNIIFTLN